MGWAPHHTPTHTHTHTHTHARAGARRHNYTGNSAGSALRAIKRQLHLRALFLESVLWGRKREVEREGEIWQVFLKTIFCPPVPAAGSTADSAAAGAAVSNAGGGTAAVTVGGSAGSSTGGRGRERTGLGDGRTGVTGRGKGKHPIAQSEGLISS